MHVNPKPTPPQPGGEYTFTTDTGRQAVPPGTPVVNLIPVGDGGPGLPLSRLRRSKKQKPLLPSRGEIAKLPLWARVAFAARCARRVEPLFHEARFTAAKRRPLQSFVNRLSLVEQAAASATLPSDRIVRSGLAYVVGSLTAPRAAGSAAEAACLCLSSSSAPPGSPDSAAWAAGAASEAILVVATDPSELRFIRRDFERLRRLARANGWTDDTPVQQEVFGPLWPEGRVPAWARETSEPRN